MKKSMEHLEKRDKMYDHEKSAKMSVLHHLKKMAESAMKDGMGGMKKVSVAANDKQGLMEGLDKAKDIVSHPESISGDPMGENKPSDHQESLDEDQKLESEVVPTHDNHEMEGMHQGGEMSPGEEEDSEDIDEEEHMSPEEIDRQIAHLQALKSKKRPH